MKNQQKVSSRFTLTVLVTFYFSLKLIGPLSVNNISKIHIIFIKVLITSIKSKEEGEDQKVKPYPYLTDLEIAWTCIRLKTSGE